MRWATTLLFALSLCGCGTVKWVKTNSSSGETWWIEQHPLGSDEIHYCAPLARAPPRGTTISLEIGMPALSAAIRTKIMINPPLLTSWVMKCTIAQ